MMCLFFFMILLEQVIKYKFKYILNLLSIGPEIIEVKILLTYTLELSLVSKIINLMINVWAGPSIFISFPFVEFLLDDLI